MARHARRLIAWTGGAVIALALLVVLATLALVWFVNPNVWRARIAQSASTALGRQLILGGDLRWDIGWNIAIASDGGFIANAPGFDATPFAQWQRMRLGLNVRSLLGKRIVIDQLAIDGLKVNLQRNAAGEGNWSFTLATGGKAAADKPITLQVSSVQLRNSQLTFVDARAAPKTPMTWQLVDLALDIKLPIDLNASSRQLREVALHGRLQGGSLPAAGIPVEFEAATLTHNSDSSTLAVPAFKAQWDDAKLSGAVDAVLGAQPTAQGKLSLRVPSIRSQLTLLKVSLPPMADPNTLGKLDVDAIFDLGGSTLEITALNALLDDTRLGGTLAVVQFSPPALRFDLTGDSMDFDRYLEPADYQGKPFELPLAQLKGLNVKGVLRMKSATLMGAKATELRIDAE
ncbi:MAG: AsmA family protein [Pseudomonadota bacterium]